MFLWWEKGWSRFGLGGFWGEWELLDIGRFVVESDGFPIGKAGFVDSPNATIDVSTHRLSVKHQKTQPLQVGFRFEKSKTTH